MKKIYIDTLGCAKNEYDSQMLAASLVQRGCSIVFEPEEADILIVNTCGFIEDAKKESIARIFELADEKDRNVKLVVTGCLSERYHSELAEEMPEVDMFFGVNDYDDLPGILLGETPGRPEAACFDAARDCVGASVDDLRYRERLFDVQGLQLNVIQKDVESNYAYFPVVIDEKAFGASREEVMRNLAAQDVMVRKYFYPLTSSYRAFHRKYDVHKTPVALHISKRILTLPLYPDLPIQDVDKICDLILRCKSIC